MTHPRTLAGAGAAASSVSRASLCRSACHAAGKRWLPARVPWGSAPLRRTPAFFSPQSAFVALVFGTWCIY